jgi:hypothetical protein
VLPRRTLVIIAVVIAVAVLATGLFLTLGGDDGDASGQPKTKSDKTASAGTTTGGATPGTDAGKGTGTGTGEGQGGSDDSDQGSSGATGAKPSTTPKPGSPAGATLLPAGYVMVSNDQFNFTMAMPKAFRLTGIAGQNSGGIFSAAGGFPRVQVDFNDSPTDDAAAAWRAAGPAVAGSSTDYKLLGIGKVAYNGYPTVADWQFERKQGGERVRVLNRGFKVDATHGYSIMITCKSSEWQSVECETLRKTAFATFKPKD